MKHYYGFSFWGSKKTTEGEPSKRGRMSIAGSIEIFDTKKDRDNARDVTPVTKKELRKLCLGMSPDEFNEHLANLIANHEYNK